MARIARLIWIDDLVWHQFQNLYPREASKTIESTLRSMINIKLEVDDEEIIMIKNEKDRLQGTADTLLAKIKELDMKERVWEAKKRQELLDEKKAEEERQQKAGIKLDTLRYSGILEDAL